MTITGMRSASKGGPLRRAWISAWIVVLAMGGTTMTYQVYHAVTAGGMPWPLAVLYGVVPLLIAILVLEIVAEWDRAPWPAKAAAYLVMAAAMFLSASATGAVVLKAAPAHFSLLPGALLDGAELLAAYFIMNGPRAADAEAARKAQEDAARERAEAEAHAAALRAEADERVALRAELEDVRGAAAAELSARDERMAGLAADLETAQARLAQALAREEKLTAKLDAQYRRNARAKQAPNSGRSGGRNRDANSRATQVPDDVDARAEALSILAAEPGISGAKLGERVGKSARWGQLLKNELAPTSAPSDIVDGGGQEAG